jgi:hypothetical protein
MKSIIIIKKLKVLLPEVLKISKLSLLIQWITPPAYLALQKPFQIHILINPINLKLTTPLFYKAECNKV